MLQGKFCLLGFSGNDPNYMGWVKWMSDILGKGNNNGTKIYLVTFKKEESSDKKLYYRNHYIQEINLMDNKVLSVLGYNQSEITNLSLSASNPYKQILECFLKFLSITENGILENTSSEINNTEDTSNTSAGNDSDKVEFSTLITDKNIYIKYKELWSEASSKFYHKRRFI